MLVSSKIMQIIVFAGFWHTLYTEDVSFISNSIFTGLQDEIINWSRQRSA
jgi:hypothetical protein